MSGQPKGEVSEEVIEEINVEDGADPSYRLDPGPSSACDASTMCKSTMSRSSSLFLVRPMRVLHTTKSQHAHPSGSHIRNCRY